MVYALSMGPLKLCGGTAQSMLWQSPDKLLAVLDEPEIKMKKKEEIHF